MSSVRDRLSRGWPIVGPLEVTIGGGRLNKLRLDSDGKAPAAFWICKSLLAEMDDGGWDKYGLELIVIERIRVGS